MKSKWKTLILGGLAIAFCFTAKPSDSDSIVLYGPDGTNVLGKAGVKFLTPGPYTAYLNAARERWPLIVGSGGSYDGYLFIKSDNGILVSPSSIAVSADAVTAPSDHYTDQLTYNLASATAVGYAYWDYDNNEFDGYAAAQSQASAWVATNSTRITLHVGACVNAFLYNGSFNAYAIAQANAVCSFTIPSNHIGFAVASPQPSVPPPVGTNTPPSLPNSIENSANPCDFMPSYVWTGASSGQWFEVPVNSERIEFSARAGSLFSVISNFPTASSSLVEFNGTTNGPFTNGQSLDFSALPNGGAEQFTLVSLQTNLAPTLQIQLAFTTLTASFGAQEVPPHTATLLLERIGVGSDSLGALTNRVFQGETVRMSAITLGACNTSYQWQSNSVPLPGATNITLTLSNVLVAQSGIYSVAVSNQLGLVESESMLLVVQLPQPTLSQPLISSNQFQTMITGLTVPSTLFVESSTDLFIWQPVLTNTLTGSNYMFETPLSNGSMFYRAIVR